MRSLEPEIQSRLARLATRTRLWRLAARLGLVGAGFFVGLLALGVLWRTGTVEQATTIALLATAIVLATGLTAVLLLVLTLARRIDSHQLAGRLEEANPNLLDRVHTVVGREAAPIAPELEAPDSYYDRIQLQIIAEPYYNEPPLHDLRRRALVALAALLLSAVGMIVYFAREQPSRPGAASHRRTPTDAAAETSLRLDEPPALIAEQEIPPAGWGEVRIIEPGKDLRVTKVDVVPLRIEVSTETPIGAAAYLTSKTGEAATEHALGAPAEPTFATYKPLLYVDEFELSDWDVLAYHATSSTRTGDRFASEVYFLEIRPFREELLKAKTGDGSGYQALSQLTGLIDEQKRILRQLYRHLNDHERSASETARDVTKIADAEDELAEAARHLYAELAADENTGIGTALDHLALAEEWLMTTAVEVRAGESSAAASAQRALAELVQARKDVQKVVGSGQGASDEEREPFVGDILREITEFRDDAEAAERAIDEIARSVRETEAAAARRDAESYPELAAGQEPVLDRLRRLEGEHPRLAERLDTQFDRAEDALERAQESLRDAAPDGHERQSEAASAVDDLRRAIGRDAATDDLKDAYRLKELLDRQVAKLRDLESDPSELDSETAEGAARDASRVVEALDETLDQPAMDGVFGPEIDRALEGTSRRRVDDALERLGSAETTDERRRAAEGSRKELERLSSAFEQSAPELARKTRSNDALEPPAPELLDRVMSRLASLLARAGQPGSGQPESQARLRGEILSLIDRIEAADAANPDQAALLARVRDELEANEEIDSDALGDLMVALQLKLFEQASESAEELDSDELTHIDLDALPPSYRKRIERYLRELSESR